MAGLCQRGVLGVDEKQILLVFRQKVYPEIDPRPEREIIERMRRAIFTDVHAVEARTVVLVALAQATDLLRVHFTRGELKGREGGDPGHAGRGRCHLGGSVRGCNGRLALSYAPA